MTVKYMSLCTIVLIQVQSVAGDRYLMRLLHLNPGQVRCIPATGTMYPVLPVHGRVVGD